MEDKKGFGKMSGKFLGGKAFYMVLLLGAGLIATTAWLLTAGSEKKTETAVEEVKVTASAVEPKVRKQPEDETVETMRKTEEQEVIRPVAPEVKTEPPAAETVNESADNYFVWPVTGTLERGYSMETLSYDKTMSDWRTHAGWDIAAEPGARVRSVANGTVESIREDDLYGTVAVISHANGVKSVYAGLAETPEVGVGDWVSVGQVIGAVGNTALAEVGEVSHLHFEMKKNDAPADPSEWLPER